MRGPRLLVGLLLAAAIVLTAGAQETDEDKAIGLEEPIRAADHLGGRRYALVIGIDDYVDEAIPDLKYCQRDAKAFYDVITDQKIGGIGPDDATLLLGAEATTRGIKTALGRLRRIPEDSTVFIYYSGHGAKELGDAYWVTQDAELRNLAGSSISDVEVKAAMEDIPARRVILIMDCCFAAALVKERKSLAEYADALTRFTGHGRAFLSAAGSTEEAIESADLKQSVFTYYVIQGLTGRADSNEDGVVVLTELTTYVEHFVADEARRRGGVQKPVVDLEQVQEGSKFLLTIDADRLRRNLLESRQQQQLREQRLAQLKALYLDRQLTLEQYRLGQRLLEAIEPDLDDEEQQQLAEFIALLDGRIAPAQLQRALDAIRPPGPTTWVVPADRPTIQAAIDAAGTGDAILVRPGTYREHVVFKSGITLRGESRRDSIIQIVSGEREILIAENCTAGLIENLTFDGTGAQKIEDWTPDGVGLVDSTITVRACTLKNAPAFGVRIAGGSGASVIEDCRCENNEVGLLVRDSGTKATLRNNECCNNTKTGIYFGQSAAGTAEGNTCEGNAWSGIAVADEGTDVLLRNNRCRSNRQSGIHVGRSARCVAEGNFCEDNELSGIRIEHEATDAAFRNNTVRRSGQNGVRITGGADASIEGSTFEHNTWCGITVTGAGTAPTLKGNRCLSNSLQGIHYSEGAAGTAEKNTCTDNGENGIRLGDADTAPTLKENECRGNTLNGILILPGAAGKLEGNVCEMNSDSGIAIFDTQANPTLENNTCRNNRKHGIFVGHSASATVRTNTCEQNDWVGLAVLGAGTTVEARFNECNRNLGAGINVFEGAGGTIRENHCAHNAESGIIITGIGSAPMIVGNFCQLNQMHGIFFGGGAGGLAEGNYCEENLYSGIALSGQGTVSLVRSNTCRNNQQYGVTVFDNASPTVETNQTFSGNVLGGVFYLGQIYD